MKTCSTCKIDRPSSHFRFKPGMSDCKDSQCRECRARAQRARAERKKIIVPMLTGTNPFDLRNYKTKINWIDNTRYVPTDVASKHYSDYHI
jgi:hypothetical protein